MIEDLLKSNQEFCENLGKISEEAEDKKSYATANLVQDLMESHGKFVWMLRSFSDKSNKKIQENVETEITEKIEQNEEINDQVEED